MDRRSSALALVLAGCFADGGGHGGGPGEGASGAGASSGEASTATSAEASTSGAATASTSGEPTTSGGSTSGASGGSTSEPTTGAAAVCGNMVVEPGEACDDGNLRANDGCDAACLVELAVCGDNEVGPGETCDDGNTSSDDGCGPTCQTESCGDGVVQMREACDDGNPRSGDGCSGSCAFEFLYAFVTTGTHDGALGGLAGADAKCQAEAEGRLPGEYRAWVAISEATRPELRFTTAAVPYRLPDGITQVAPSLNGLQGGINHAIDQTADGAAAPTDAALCGILRTVWTGINSNAQWADNDDCLGWTSADDNDVGRAGYHDVDTSQWTDACKPTCGRQLRLYCFQQA